MHLSPKERFGYVALGAILLVSIGFVAMQKLRRPASIEMHEAYPSLNTSIPRQPISSNVVPQIVVHVAGAVRYPGLISVPPGSRVFDAVSAAGGPTPEANLDAINLASKAIDGSQIMVPSRIASSALALGSSVGSSSRASSKAPPIVVNLNSATLDQFLTLPGVGKTMGQRILDYRNEHGPFQAVDDLALVQGFGKKRLDRIRQWLICQ